MNTRKSQTGFAPLLVIFIIVVVALAGFAIWRMMDKDTPVTGTTSEETTQASTQDLVDLTAYTSVNEGLKFDFPSDWKQDPRTSSDPAVDEVTITTAAGSTIRWSSMVDGLGGGCDEEQPNLFVSAFEEADNLKGVYYTELTEDGKVAIIGLKNEKPTIGETDSCLFFATFPSKKNPEATLWLSAQINDPNAAEDIAAIKAMMLSTRY